MAGIRIGHSRRDVLRAMGATAAAGLLVSCGGDDDDDAEGGGGGSGAHGNFPETPEWNFVFINHVTTNPFFVPTQYGIEDASALLGTSFQWTGSERADNTEMVNAHVILASTRWGVHTVATGGNPIGAREAGVQTKRIKVGTFMLAAVFAGFAGISEAIRVTSIDPLSGGSGLMFLGIAAAVIGGTALAGGSGTVIGAFIGALFLGVLRDGLTIKGISAFTYNMILGIAIIASMILNSAANRLRIRTRRYA